MAGTIISDFNDLNEATGSAWINSPKGLILEAVKQEYLSSRFFAGDIGTKKMIQAGVDIRHSLTFQDNGTFGNYLPGEYRTWRNPQRLTHSVAPWRFSEAHKSWTDPEVLLNPRVAFTDGDARTQAFVDIMYEKEAIMWASIWNGLEGNLAAVPNYDSMENADSTDPKPHSLFSLVNEDTNGLWGSGWVADPDGTFDSGTLHGINPAAASTDGRWAPQQRTYGSTAAGNIDGIHSAFELMDLDVKFLKPRSYNQYWEDETIKMQMIITSTIGRATFSYLASASNDFFRAGPQDGSYGTPVWHGIPIHRWDSMDTAAIYEPAGSGTTPLSETAGDKSGTATTDVLYRGPRYLFINANYLCPVVHGERYFYMDKVARHPNVPDTWVQPTTIWYNYKLLSRQRHGIISPSNNSQNFPGANNA